MAADPAATQPIRRPEGGLGASRGAGAPPSGEEITQPLPPRRHNPLAEEPTRAFRVTSEPPQAGAPGRPDPSAEETQAIPQDRPGRFGPTEDLPASVAERSPGHPRPVAASRPSSSRAPSSSPATSPTRSRAARRSRRPAGPAPPRPPRRRSARCPPVRACSARRLLAPAPLRPPRRGSARRLPTRACSVRRRPAPALPLPHRSAPGSPPRARQFRIPPVRPRPAMPVWAACGPTRRSAPIGPTAEVRSA